MSSYLFDRVAILTVGVSATEGREYKGFRITFSSEQNLEKDANTAKVSIFNLNPDSIGLVEKPNQIAILEVGYKGIATRIETSNGVFFKENTVSEVLISGDIKNLLTEVKGNDRVTSFEIGDGEETLNNSIVNKSFPPGVGAQQVVDEIVSTFDVVKGAISDITNFKFESGLSLEGKSKDRLEEVLAKDNKEFSIQNGELQIIERGGSLQEEAILLTPSSGLVGSPTRKLIKTKDNGDQEGVELISLLNTKLKPGRRIRVDSRSVQGDFTVRKVIHSGDTNGSSFISKVEAL